MTTDPYGTLGVGYATRRRTDPRVAVLIDRALAGCASVVNVGAGTGSYEPPTTALAVEPSATMLAQRAPGAAPAVRARAEALPLVDGAVDAALAVLTVHHWADPAAGLAELVRVARRQVVLTWDPARVQRFWLVADYLPEIGEQERGSACLDTVVATLSELSGPVEVVPIPVPSGCVDGFLAAHWQRPHAYLDPAVRAAVSGLAALPAAVLGRGLRRLADDLAGGRWHERYADLQVLDELDVGYRLVVAGH